MIKDNKFSPIIVSVFFVASVKISTLLIKNFYSENVLLQNIGTANGIFSKPASNFPNFLDYFIVISYISILILLYQFDWFLNNKSIKNIFYFSSIFLALLLIATSIVFQEFRGWDLSLYCVTDISKDIQDAKVNIYDFEYQKIKPGLSPLIWLIYNKICNFSVGGFSYLNIYFWIQMFFGTALVIKYFNFSILECICLSTGLNLSMLAMVRTGNYGYIFAIIMAIALRNLLQGHRVNINIVLLAVITFFKLQYLVVIFLFLILQKINFKMFLNISIKFSGIYLAYFGLQLLIFRKSFTDFINLLINGYLTNELGFEAGINNPVVSQFISRFLIVNLNIGIFIVLVVVVVGIYSLKNNNSKFLIATSLFNRNKNYDSNYLLTAIENKFVTEFIFVFCFVPNILFLLGSIFSLGPLSELLYVPGLFYVVMLSNKRS